MKKRLLDGGHKTIPAGLKKYIMDNLKDYMTPLSKKIRDLEALGYTAQYQWKEGHLENTENHQQYGKGDLQISRKYRFEGTSNPSDEAILYALESSDGNKGTLVNAYGPYADDALDEFLQGVADKSGNREAR